MTNALTMVTNNALWYNESSSPDAFMSRLFPAVPSCSQLFPAALDSSFLNASHLERGRCVASGIASFSRTVHPNNFSTLSFQLF